MSTARFARTQTEHRGSRGVHGPARTRIFTIQLNFEITSRFIQIMFFPKIVIAVLLAVAGARIMSTRELIVRIKFCQAKTCNKCAKMLKSYNTFKMKNVSFIF